MIDVAVVSAQDWKLWRALRLAALAEAPEAFGSGFADWSGPGDTEARWRGRLDNVALNLVLTLDCNPAGMVSALSPDGAGQVGLISLWITPTARGRGVGDEAIRRVLAWADDAHQGSPVILSVKVDNGPAHRLYERHGFADAGPSPDDPTEQLMRR